MGIENLAEDLLNEPDDRKEKESKTRGSVEDDIIEGQRRIKDEIQELQLRVAESKKSKLQNFIEFQEEFAGAKKESKEWEKLLKLALEKRKPTLAEMAVLKEERLAALQKAAEAAKGAGVENLESVEAELRATEEAFKGSEPRRMGEMLSEMQTREMALREKERLLTEARFWLKKAMIIQALIEVDVVGVEGEVAPPRDLLKNKSEERPRRIVGPNEIIKLSAAEGHGEREVRVVKAGDKIIVECAKFGDAVEAIEQMERDGLPGLGIDKDLGLINLKTGRIDQRKVEIRFFTEESGNVRKSISLKRYTGD